MYVVSEEVPPQRSELRIVVPFGRYITASPGVLQVTLAAQNDRVEPFHDEIDFLVTRLPPPVVLM